VVRSAALLRKMDGMAIPPLGRRIRLDAPRRAILYLIP
jgi:hypothetical protein